ncbi:MAG: serine/threonine-protein kinase [Pseudomonadota bacterium]
MDPTRFGKFLLLDEIATGGMAEIYKAVGIAVGGQSQTLAIKRILPQFSSDDEFVSLLIDEAKLMVLLNHPNIVPIIEFGKAEDSYYIAMDYVQGTTLKDLFRRVREQNLQFPIDLACHIVREIGSGLAYAHRRTDKSGQSLQIVHRDISPANILISFEGDVKIADFGISKAATQRHRTQIGVIRGKTGYMSPEQTRSGETIDGRSDLYSLGIIFWELLTGERLYVAGSVPEALAMIRKSVVRPPSALRNAVPAKLDDVALRALTSEARERYQKGEDFVDAVNEFLGRFAPGGRPVRVTHNDLAGYLRRFFGEEIQAALAAQPVALNQVITRVESTSDGTEVRTEGKREPTKPETIVQNPLFEMSVPEAAIPREFPVTVPSASATEPTMPNSWKSVTEAPVEVVFKGSGGAALAWTLAIATFLVVSLVLAVFRYQKIRETEPHPTGVVAVTVTSDPGGAEILIDGQTTGKKTPGKVEVPIGRTVKVTVSKPGYVSDAWDVSPQGAGLRHTFQMVAEKGVKPTVGKLVLTVEPPQASVFVDDQKATGGSPYGLDLPLKKPVAIRIEAAGFKVWQDKIQADDVKPVERTVVLARLPPPGIRTRTTQPVPAGPISKNAKLSMGFVGAGWGITTIDGKEAAQDRMVGVVIEPGRHKVVVSNNTVPGKPCDFVLTIAAGQHVKCFCDLERGTANCTK